MPETGPSSALAEGLRGPGHHPADRTLAAVGTAPHPDHRPPQTAVTRELAHRTADTDVFPTRWHRISDTRFRFTAHWPADHPFLGPVDERHQDPMIVGETLRQTSMVLAHAEFGAPPDTRFVMADLAVGTDPDALLLSEAGEPVEIDVECSEVRRRGRRLAGMRTTMEFRRAGRLVARGTGSTGCVSPAAYRRLRAGRLDAWDTPVPPLPGLPPGAVGRARAADVLLAPTGRPGLWRLRVDTGHPHLFPRPNDHVPGMALLEAARQAAAAASGVRPFLPSSMSVVFARYAELHDPCLLVTELLATEPLVTEPLGADPQRVTVRVTGRQGGETVFTAVLTSARTAPVRSVG
ncbi:ScbA/BarX family gamma-butyrolactone biosynthesis protein [Streptomyces sp. NPDC004830]